MATVDQLLRLLWFLCHVADVSADVLKECTVTIFRFTSTLK